MKKIPICFGAGLVALDVILNGSPATLPKLSAGGSCGNVISILGYLGWHCNPIARLANDQAAAELINDLKRWDVHIENISVNDEGSTPIIIHRILRDKLGKPIHRFEFRDPETKTWLPQFKPITRNIAADIINQDSRPQVFYFDRMNPGTLELARHLKSQGAVIYFEPSSIKDSDEFEKFLAISDIVKFSHDRIPDFKERYPSSRCFLEIETLGTQGLVYRTKKSSAPDQWRSIKAFSLSNIQDAAGAGDWFTSGIIYRLCSDGAQGLRDTGVSTIKSALQFGQMLGAFNCLYDGARGLMYYYESKKLLSLVNHFIAEKGIETHGIHASPRIDISTKSTFSELLMTIK
jgi:sugar/nucleoside kinase (ribokinase family)